MAKLTIMLALMAFVALAEADRLLDSYNKLRKATSYSSSKLGKASRKIENMDYSDDFYDYFNIDPVDIKVSSNRMGVAAHSGKILKRH